MISNLQRTVSDTALRAFKFLGTYLVRYVEREESKAAQAALFIHADSLVKAREESILKAELEAKEKAENSARPLPGQEELEEQLNTVQVSASAPQLPRQHELLMIF